MINFLLGVILGGSFGVVLFSNLVFNKRGEKINERVTNEAKKIR